MSAVIVSFSLRTAKTRFVLLFDDGSRSPYRKIDCCFFIVIITVFYFFNFSDFFFFHLIIIFIIFIALSLANLFFFYISKFNFRFDR